MTVVVSPDAAVFSPALNYAARTRLGAGRIRADRPLTDMHRSYLEWHVAKVFVAGLVRGR